MIPARALLRRALAGKDCDFRFRRLDALPAVDLPRAHIYIHVPFCQDKCPFCPYYKERYAPEAAVAFGEALSAEIDLVAGRFGEIEVPSVYIGGGTPALLLDGLSQWLDRLRRRFRVTGSIAIELRPEDCHPGTLRRLRGDGVTQASVGVQSFQPDVLRRIGRRSSPGLVEEALPRLVDAGFAGVNADMMFAIPGQTMAGLRDDVGRIAASGVDQVTYYPLFTFSYAAAGDRARQGSVRMPPFRERYRQYRFIWDRFLTDGYEPASVWSFIKNGAPRFSSVTRDVYIGLGAGAASCMPGHFWFNPFDVRTYAEAVGRRNLPAQMHMPVPKRLTDLYWLYWRLYETFVPEDGVADRFGTRPIRLRAALRLGRLLGWIRRTHDGWRLTRSGSFWVHLAQNHLLLDSIDRYWRAAGAVPCPDEIDI